MHKKPTGGRSERKLAHYTRSRIKNEREREYYQQPRNDILEFIRNSSIDLNNKRILEIGPGNGRFFATCLNEWKPKSAHCIELNKANETSLKKIFDNVKIHNIEKFRIDFHKYDTIIMLDVIEHLIDPTGFMQKLKKSLDVNAKIIISLPNGSHFSILKELLLDKIDYSQNGGLLDYTHYHLFTHRSFKKMIQNMGYYIIKHNRKIPSEISIVNILSLGIISHLFTYQNFYILSLTLEK